MASKSKGISPSFPLEEHEEIIARVRELKLPERGGLSQYFQMLRDYDRHMKLRPHYHQSDGKLHFYPEEAAPLSQAAEDQTRYSATLTKKKTSAASGSPGAGPALPGSQPPHTDEAPASA